MLEMTDREKEYWDERSSEIIRCGEPLRGPEIDDYNRTHPIPSKEEIERIIREATE